MEKASMKRVLSGFLAVMIMVLSFTAMPTFTASATNKTRDEALNWIRSQVGQQKGDGQCVALIKAYYEYLGVSAVSGNGADYSWNTVPAGWQRIAGAQPQPGDILVYTGGYGHVAIYEANSITYHQNYAGQLSVRKVTNIAYNHSGITSTTPYWGIIRPNWGSGSTPAYPPINLGDRFDAAILRTDVWRTVVNNGGSVELGQESGRMRDFWWFERQSDGSYTIKSLEDGKMLDVHLSGKVNGTVVKVADANGADAQKWFIYGSAAAYRLVPKCATNLNLDVVTGATNYGAKLQLFEPNGSVAQVFSIYKTERNIATRFSINSSRTVLTTNQTSALNISVTPSGALTGNISWTSSNTSVATVSSGGVVTGRSVGKATITAVSTFDSSIKASITIEVVAATSPTATPTATPKPTQSPTPPPAITTGWKTEGTSTVYYNTSGNKVTGWQTISGKTFYFDKSGKMLTGWQDIGGKEFFFKRTGANGTKGYMHTGWNTIDGKKFFFKRTGANGTRGYMHTGWNTIDGKKFFFKRTGANGTIGHLHTGWHTIDGKKFFFKRTGANGTIGHLHTGWHTIDGKRYYFKRTGANGTIGHLHIGWHTIDKKRVYFDSKGVYIPNQR